MTEWQWSSFADLPNADLYEMLAQRQDVFVLEQQCLYPDMDGYDQGAWHLLGWRIIDGKRQLAASLRVICAGREVQRDVARPRAVNARLRAAPAPAASCSSQGIAHAEQLHPGHRIRIGAQQYLEAFYASFGFKTVSEPYDEDGIMHVEMLR